MGHLCCASKSIPYHGALVLCKQKRTPTIALVLCKQKRTPPWHSCFASKSVPNHGTRAVQAKAYPTIALVLCKQKRTPPWHLCCASISVPPPWHSSFASKSVPPPWHHAQTSCLHPHSASREPQHCARPIVRRPHLVHPVCSSAVLSELMHGRRLDLDLHRAVRTGAAPTWGVCVAACACVHASAQRRRAFPLARACMQHLYVLMSTCYMHTLSYMRCRPPAQHDAEAHITHHTCNGESEAHITDYTWNEECSSGHTTRRAL